MESLYKIREDILNVMALDDDDPAKFDTLEMLELDFHDKLDNVLMYRQSLLREAEAFKAEIDRMTAIKKALEAKAERLERYTIEQMQATNKVKHEGLFKVTIGKPSKQVNILDVNELPLGFYRMEVVPDKAAIKKAIESGETITGASLIDGKPRLTIK